MLVLQSMYVEDDDSEDDDTCSVIDSDSDDNDEDSDDSDESDRGEWELEDSDDEENGYGDSGVDHDKIDMNLCHSVEQPNQTKGIFMPSSSKKFFNTQQSCGKCEETQRLCKRVDDNDERMLLPDVSGLLVSLFAFIY